MLLFLKESEFLFFFFYEKFDNFKFFKNLIFCIRIIYDYKVMIGKYLVLCFFQSYKILILI